MKIEDSRIGIYDEYQGLFNPLVIEDNDNMKYKDLTLGDIIKMVKQLTEDDYRGGIG